jgi:hypothetical protein
LPREPKSFTITAMPLTPTTFPGRTAGLMGTSSPKPPGMGGPVMRMPGIGFNAQDEMASLTNQFPGVPQDQIASQAQQMIGQREMMRRMAMNADLAGLGGGGGGMPHRAEGGDVKGSRAALHPHGQAHRGPTWMQFSGLDPRQNVRVGKEAGTEGQPSPMSYAGRTGGLAKFYQDQNRLSLEKGARGAPDPVGGLSQTPTEKEINAQIDMFNQRGDFDQGALMSDYYNAKRSGDPAALAAAAAAVQDYKHKLNATREQEHPYIVNEKGTEAFQPKGGMPELIPGGKHVATFPSDGKVIPANKVAESFASDSAKGEMPLHSLGGQAAAGRTASLMADRSISTPYGKASVRGVAPTGPAYFNQGHTYDPNFAQKAAGMKDASSFTAVGQPPPTDAPTGTPATTLTPPAPVPSISAGGGESAQNVTPLPAGPDVPRVVPGRPPVPAGYTSDLAYELARRQKELDMKKALPQPRTHTLMKTQQPAPPAIDFKSLGLMNPVPDIKKVGRGVGSFWNKLTDELATRGAQVFQ